MRRSSEVNKQDATATDREWITQLLTPAKEESKSASHVVIVRASRIDVSRVSSQNRWQQHVERCVYLQHIFIQHFFRCCFRFGWRQQKKERKRLSSVAWYLRSETDAKHSPFDPLRGWARRRIILGVLLNELCCGFRYENVILWMVHFKPSDSLSGIKLQLIFFYRPNGIKRILDSRPDNWFSCKWITIKTYYLFIISVQSEQKCWARTVKSPILT